MIADIVESCEMCKLLDKTQYETRHGFCEFKQAKRRYSNWTCFKYVPKQEVNQCADQQQKK